MEAYSHNDPRIREWINQIIENIFTSCILTGVDSDVEFQKGCQIVIKLTSLLQETPTLPSEFLADRVKQLIEQQLPDERVINSLPTFQPTMDRMIHEGILKVTDSPIDESFDSSVSDNVIPTLSTINIPYPTIKQMKAETQAKAEAQMLTEALAQVEAQAKIDAIALSEALEQIDTLTQAEARAKADSLTLAEALEQAEAQAKSDALALAKAEEQANANSLALAEALEQAETQAKSDALALAQAEELANANSLALAQALEQAEAQANVDTQVETLTNLEPDLIKTPALVTSMHSKVSQELSPLQIPNETNLLKHVLTNLFPKATINWNKNLMGQTFLAQVEDILIYIHDPKQPCDLIKYAKDGWKVLVCSSEDLTYPRRLERRIRQIQRSSRRTMWNAYDH